MMQLTTNYSLRKIELTDAPPDITVLNPNFDTIDTELKRQDTTMQNVVTAANNAYQKPSTGIPKTDLDSGVQASLNKADSSAPSSHVGAGGTAQHPLGNGATAGFSTNDYSATEKTAVANAVPNTRKVNSKALSADITLAAADIAIAAPTLTNSAIAASDTLQVAAGKLQAQVNAKAAVTTYTATITATWTGSAAPYSQSVTVSGVLAADTPIVDIVQTGTAATDQTMRDNWAKVTRIVTAANSITVYASDKTTANVPIQLKCVR